MMKHHRFTFMTAVILALAVACLPSCKSNQETPPAKTDGPAIDPLLGKWEVTEASGDFAEANKGMTYDFAADGKVKTWAVFSGKATGGRDFNRKPGEIMEYEWSWKRTGPDAIEMTHSKSPIAAVVKLTFVENRLIMSWNDGGQAFTLARQDDLAR